MACLGVLGCKNTHRSAGSYVLMVLAILGIALAVRVVLYALARWLQRWQQRRAEEEEETAAAAVEMQGGQREAALYGNTQRQRSSRRRTPTVYSRPPQECAVNVCRHGHHGTS